MSKQRLIEAGVFVLLGLTIVRLSMEYTYMDKFTPGPGLFPFWLGIALTVMGGILFLSGLRPAVSVKKSAGIRLRSLVPFGILVLLVATMNFLGAVVSIAFFTVASIRFIHPKTSWAGAVAVGVILSLACYGVFDRLLGVPLPKGILGI